MDYYYNFYYYSSFSQDTKMIAWWITCFSENQQFLKDVTSAVLEGRGIGWLKLGKVKKLMEDENYRNFVVSRLNITLEKKLSDENQHLEDVVSK